MPPVGVDGRVGAGGLVEGGTYPGVVLMVLKKGAPASRSPGSQQRDEG